MVSAGYRYWGTAVFRYTCTRYVFGWAKKGVGACVAWHSAGEHVDAQQPPRPSRPPPPRNIHGRHHAQIRHNAPVTSANRYRDSNSSNSSSRNRHKSRTTHLPVTGRGRKRDRLELHVGRPGLVQPRGEVRPMHEPQCLGVELLSWRGGGEGWFVRARVERERDGKLKRKPTGMYVDSSIHDDPRKSGEKAHRGYMRTKRAARTMAVAAWTALSLKIIFQK